MLVFIHIKHKKYNKLSFLFFYIFEKIKCNKILHLALALTTENRFTIFVQNIFRSLKITNKNI